MADHNLDSLDPMAFTRLIPTREAHFAAAEARTPAHYPANRLAAALHPAYQHLVVSEVKAETEDSRVYTLVPDGDMGCASLAYFDAGQYLCVYIEDGSVVTQRPYSILSSPRDSLRGFYKICVKAVEGGFVSNHILENWCVGTKVRTSAPLGEFTYEPLRDCESVMAVCGGSGITPILSLAKAISEGTEELSLTVLYGSRFEEGIICRQELDILSEKCENIKVVYVLSHEEKEGYERGFISASLIKKYAPEGKYSLFMCGPEAMYKSLEGEISDLSLERKQVRREVQSECFAPAPDSPDSVNITVKADGELKTVKASGKDTILRALEKAGVAAPSHCRGGECGYCRSRLVSGKVYIPEGLDMRRLADSRYGYIHPCCSFPMTDIEIEVFPKR